MQECPTRTGQYTTPLVFMSAGRDDYKSRLTIYQCSSCINLLCWFFSRSGLQEEHNNLSLL